MAGIGLRKANALRINIKSVLGFESSRRELFERKLLDRVVYTNVRDNGLGELQLDPLTTRACNRRSATCGTTSRPRSVHPPW